MKKALPVALAFLLLLSGSNAFTFVYEIPAEKDDYPWSAGEEAILGSGLNVSPEDLPALEIDASNSNLRSLNPNHAEKYRLVLYGITPSYETIEWGGTISYTVPLVKIAARYWRGEGYKVKNIKEGYKALNCSPGIIAAAQWLKAYGNESEPPKQGAGDVVSRCELGDSGMLVFYVTSIEGGKMKIETRTSTTGQPFNVWVPDEEEGKMIVHFKIALRRNAGGWEEHTEWLSSFDDLEELGLEGAYLNVEVEEEAEEEEPGYQDPDLPVTEIREGECNPRITSVSFNGESVFSQEEPDSLVFQVPSETQADLESGNDFSITASVSEECAPERIFAFVSVYPIWDSDAEPTYPYSNNPENERIRQQFLSNLEGFEIPESFDFSNPFDFSLSAETADDFWSDNIEEFGRLYVGLYTERDGIPAEWSNTVAIRIEGTVEEEPSAGAQLPESAAGAITGITQQLTAPSECDSCSSILQCLACIQWNLGAALFGNWAGAGN